MNTQVMPIQESVSWPRRASQFSIVRLILALLITLPPVILAQVLAKFISKDPVVFQVLQLIGLAGSFGTYCLYVRWIEQRPVTELAPQPALPEWGTGFLYGALMLSGTVGILAVVGAYKVESVASWTLLVKPFFVHLGVGFFEELLTRAIIFRIIERSLGTTIALLLSALLFGAMHMANPHVTPFAVLNVALAGVMLAGAYLANRRLWVAFGLHTAWNFFQGAVFNIAVSGTPVKGMLVGHMTGPEWLTGGEFGIEASGLTLVVLVIASVLFLRQAIKNGNIIKPFWQRAEG